jgi:hypothetical protein
MEHLVFLKDICFFSLWYILRPVGIIVAVLVFAFHFGLLYQEKCGNLAWQLC